MSSGDNSPNTIRDMSNEMRPSSSNARFQIAKVSDDDSNSKNLSVKTPSIPISK